MRSTISANRTFLMGIAMIAIILFHHGWTIIPGVTAFFSRFGLWGVDIFVFLSGFGCVYALNKYSRNAFWLKRIIRLLPTCLLAGVLIFCVDLYFHSERTITYIPIRLMSIHRWYIQTIIVCYLMCPLAYIVIRKFRVTGLLILVAAAILVEQLLPDVPVWKINWAFGRIPVFLIGMYIAMYDLDMRPWQRIISIICLILAALIRCRGGYSVFQWTYFLAAAMPFVCESICRLSNLFIKIRSYHIIELFGIYSLEIYLIHEYFFWVFYERPLPLWCKYVLYIVVVSLLVVTLKKASALIVKIINL